MLNPTITVSSDDYQRLHALLENLPENAAVDRLVNELERATVVERSRIPKSVVAMHSRVTFTVLSKQRTFTYTLAYPGETIENGALSVLTPVGSALLGLSIGQEIEWPLEDGKTTQVRIHEVS